MVLEGQGYYCKHCPPFPQCKRFSFGVLIDFILICFNLHNFFRVKSTLCQDKAITKRGYMPIS